MDYIDKAIDLSIENVLNNDGGPFGAVIVCDDKILSVGKN